MSMNMKPKQEVDKANLDPLFKPRSIAHVGASAQPAAGRFNFTRFLQLTGFEGDIYPVNPKYEEVLELKCYPSIAEIPEEKLDLAILAVPAVHCPGILRDVPPGKLKFVIIHTSGFREIDKQDLEAEILQMAREKGFRVVGPNCMGVYSQQGKVGFWRDHWEIVNRPGSVGFISQSGGHAVNIIFSGMDAGINFNKVISLGNQLDVSISEVIEYMGNDDTIGVIGAYVEEIRDGREFMRVLKEVGRRKPVVVWKGGVSPVGKEAAASHTGSMGGNEQIFAAAMRQSGVITVDDFSELLPLVRLLQPEFELPGERLAVFSPGGGNTVSICDVFSKYPDIRLPRLGEETQEKLRAILPEENVDVKNPVDPGAVGFLRLDELIKVVGADPEIESILMLMAVDYLSNIKTEENRVLAVEMISNMLDRMTKRIGKPIHVLVQQQRQNHEDFDRYRRIMVNKFSEKHIPWIDGSFKDVATAFSKLARYRNSLKDLTTQ
jgi:acyl-CoA synthetase (NDP forming)